jgi:hypothetical protein
MPSPRSDALAIVRLLHGSLGHLCLSSLPLPLHGTSLPAQSTHIHRRCREAMVVTSHVRRTSLPFNHRCINIATIPSFHVSLRRRSQQQHNLPSIKDARVAIRYQAREPPTARRESLHWWESNKLFAKIEQRDIKTLGLT